MSLFVFSHACHIFELSITDIMKKITFQPSMITDIMKKITLQPSMITDIIKKITLQPSMIRISLFETH